MMSIRFSLACIVLLGLVFIEKGNCIKCYQSSGTTLATEATECTNDAAKKGCALVLDGDKVTAQSCSASDTVTCAAAGCNCKTDGCNKDKATAAGGVGRLSTSMWQVALIPLVLVILTKQ